MKTAKELFDKRYEYYRNIERNPPIPVESREFIFNTMEEYAREFKIKGILRRFIKWYNMGYEQSMNPDIIINEYLKKKI
jgi:hypothetical protein